MEEKESVKSRKMTDASVLVNPNGLNDKQEAFCRIYAAQPLPRNATRAYVEAYQCTERAAGASVVRLLSDARVQARIHALNAEFTARHFITRDNVLAGFWRIYEQCIDAVPVVDAKGRPVTTKVTVNGPDGKEVQEVRGVWKFDSKGANSALQSIARYLGLFNADTSGTTNVNVSVEVAAVRDFITAEMSRLHGSNGHAADGVPALAAGVAGAQNAVGVEDE